MFKELLDSKGKMVAFFWSSSYNQTYRNFPLCLT